MDTDIIEQYRKVKKECEDLNARARMLRKELADMESGKVRDRVRGGIGGETAYIVEGQSRAYSKKKTALQRSLLRMEQLQEWLYESLDEVETYIAAVPDPEKRLIMRLHYQDGLSWSKTARNMGEGYSPDAIRVSIMRFLREEKKKHKET